MPSSKAAIVGVSGSLDHCDTGAHASGLIHTGTDASRRKESRGQRPHYLWTGCIVHMSSQHTDYVNFNRILAFQSRNQGVL